MTNQKRIEEIEYLRGFAILSVLAIHTSANFTKIPSVNLLLLINVIVDVFSHYAVPLFIFISGFILFKKYNATYSIYLFYKKRALSILPPYFVFSIVYILFNIFKSYFNGTFEIPSIYRLLFYLFTASSAYHLPFFVLIIQLYVLFPYIIKVYDYYEQKNKTILFLSLSFMTQQVWTYFIGILITYYQSTAVLFLTRLFFSHIFYFILGFYVCQNYEKVINKIINLKSSILILVIMFTSIISYMWIKNILDFGTFHDIPQSYFILPKLIGTLYFSLIFLILLLHSSNMSNTKNNYSNFIYSMGKYSFGIYLIHVIYMQIIIECIYPQLSINPNQMIFYPVLFTLTIILSYSSVYLISYIPYSELIIGINNRKSS